MNFFWARNSAKIAPRLARAKERKKKGISRKFAVQSTHSNPLNPFYP